MTQSATVPAAGRRLPAGEYVYADLQTGDRYDTQAITLTESHIVAFAGITGDFFDVHMDDTFAREQGFPGRIAHGLLGLALIDGLKTRSAVRLCGIATLGWNWTFCAPLLPGDRIYAEITVVSKRPTKRADRGIVTFGLRMINQHESPRIN
ncbi:MaoC family dehydratase [Candidatus Sodalis sp. SoCistrobi]|uniref:MaoC family dehydratase n=1 Tax=Candidatus Sodalis sp. SoCistrobi TaxID=1922216 RepID=UPI00093E2EAA|nr:MaoC family dehydratase [Candidatus Sodalis sp. SoCistrobi]